MFEQIGDRVLLDTQDITLNLKPIIEKLKSIEWTFGQTPKFTLELKGQVLVSVEKGMIVDIKGTLFGQDLIGQYLHLLKPQKDSESLVNEIKATL